MSPDDFDPKADAITDELSRFDDDFRPDPGIRPNLDSLPDGDYDLLIEQADLAHTPEKKELILRLSLQVVGQPRAVEHAYFFRTQRSVNKLGWDLQMLGFPADRWNAAHGSRFSVELQGAVPRLAGCRFRARKTSRKDGTGKDYHDLMIHSPRPGQAMPSSPSAPLATAATPPTPGANGPRRPPAGVPLGTDDEIPF